MSSFKEHSHCKHCLSQDCRPCTGLNRFKPHLTKIQSTIMRILRENQLGVLFIGKAHKGTIRTNPRVSKLKTIDHTKYDLKNIRKSTIMSLIDKKLIVKSEYHDDNNSEFYEINDKTL